MGYLICLIIGCIIGFGISAFLIGSKIQDLRDEKFQLKCDNDKLRRELVRVNRLV